MVCENCGYRFTSRQMYFADTSVTISDACETCPVCHGPAFVIDGTYEFVGETLKAFRPLNRKQRRNLHSVLEKAKRGKLDEPELIDAVAEISPELGAVIRRARNGQYTYVALMIFLMLLLQRCSGGSLMTINRTEINLMWTEAVAQAEVAEQLSTDRDDAEEDDEPTNRDDTSSETSPEAAVVHSNVALTDPENVQNKPPRSDR
ncbi:hypothetical protein HY26_07165 [Hyphomonas sp. GM-8P]|nr:hypothetical protein HY26_07165 [Hyphomonas sp. GM-8P]